jgi:hypothetical protein
LQWRRCLDDVEGESLGKPRKFRHGIRARRALPPRALQFFEVEEGNPTLQRNKERVLPVRTLLYNLLSVKDCKPFINRATVIGLKKDDILIADEIHLQPM